MNTKEVSFLCVFCFLILYKEGESAIFFPVISALTLNCSHKLEGLNIAFPQPGGRIVNTLHRLPFTFFLSVSLESDIKWGPSFVRGREVIEDIITDSLS